MAVNVTAQVENPQATILKLEISMPFNDWERLLKALESQPYPQWKLATAISKALDAVRGSVLEKLDIPD